VLTLNRRLNTYAMRHPWRFAGAGFWTALAWSNRRRGRPMPTYQKLSIVAGMLVGFYVLGLLLQVTGLLR
jgi:hypothetical protein